MAAGAWGGVGRAGGRPLLPAGAAMAGHIPGRGSRPAPYSPGKVAAAVGACDLSLGCLCTPSMYVRWAAARHRWARAYGAPPPRLPSAARARALCGGWPGARALVLVADAELVAARERWLPVALRRRAHAGPLDRLARLAARELAVLGLSDSDLARCRQEGFGWMLLDHAGAVAAAVGVPVMTLTGMAGPTGTDGVAESSARAARCFLTATRFGACAANAASRCACCAARWSTPGAPWKRCWPVATSRRWPRSASSP